MTVSVKGAGRSSLVKNASTTTERGEWVTQAKCRNGDPDALFVRGAEQLSACRPGDPRGPLP